MARFLASTAYVTNESDDYSNLVVPVSRHTYLSGTSFYDRSQTRLQINVSGVRFQTMEKTLARFPDTLLGNAEKRGQYYDPALGEYFFDRHPVNFMYVLNYYQTGGRLRRPQDVSAEAFLEELEFYQLDEKIIRKYKSDEGFQRHQKLAMPKNIYQLEVWKLFEHPESSQGARGMAIFSMLVIILSITVVCLETMPQFDALGSHKCSYIATLAANTNQTAKQLAYQEGIYQKIFSIIETVCVVWFCVELLARFISSPDKRAFVTTSVMNWVDFFSILPFFISMGAKGGIQKLTVLRVLRLVRIFRVFKLSRHSKGLKILGHTLQASFRELCMLFVFLVIGVVLFASTAYFAEQYFNDYDNCEQFGSIPSAFWWAMITMTTVGYGDAVPKSPLGKIVGSMCALTGVLTLALPVPVIVSNFNFFYRRAQEETKYEHEQEQYRNLMRIESQNSLHHNEVQSATNVQDDAVLENTGAETWMRLAVPKKTRSIATVVNMDQAREHNAKPNRVASDYAIQIEPR